MGYVERRGGHGAPVLVVEDDRGMRFLLEAMLQDAGYAVALAAGEEEALALVERGRQPALLITDVSLTGMGGPALARLIQDRVPAVPVLFISGYSRAHLPVLDAFDRAAFLQKPFSSTALVATVAAVLSASVPRPNRPPARSASTGGAEP